MKTSTHIFARSFALTLLALILSVPAWAQKLEGKGTEDNPFLIGNATDWMTFVDTINRGYQTRAFFKLTSDIVLGTDEQPLDTIVGWKQKYFRGSFDGDFHTLYINMKRDKNYAAPFGIVNGATIKNLNVEGTIVTDHKFAGGIVAYADNAYDKTTSLINCVSSIHIICDNIVTLDPTRVDDCTHGGFVGQNEKGTLSFENCIFKGLIEDTKEVKTAVKCTGFVGWVNNNVIYKNCIMAGVIDVKPNDSKLKNSMANFHRLSGSAHAYYLGDSYTAKDYTYKGLAKQGQVVSTTAPSDCITRKFNVDGQDYFFPEVEIIDDIVTYCGVELREGVDYTKTEVNKYVAIYEGLNDYVGKVTIDNEPRFTVKVDAWDAETKTGWHAIATPVNGQKFANVSNLTSAIHNIYRYNEEKRLWEEYRNIKNYYDFFENGRGYLYRTEDNGGNIVFKGVENSNDIKYTLSYTSKTDKMSGFNLIGNPYPHNIYKSVAIPNDNLVSGYSILTKQGTWQIKDDKEAITEGIAILVQVSPSSKAEKIEITMKDTSEAPMSKDANDELWFTVKNSEYSDVAHVEFSEGEGFHKMAHFNEEAPMLYVKHNFEDYASANISDKESISLCFESKAMGNYTLNFKANGNFDYLHLIDRLTGKDIDMLLNDEYTFISSSTDIAERFIVKLNSSDDNANVGNSTFAWQSGNDVIVEGDGQLQVFDVTGRMVVNTVIDGSESINLQSQGVYIFRLIGNEVKTQKIAVR